MKELIQKKKEKKTNAIKNQSHNTHWLRLDIHIVPDQILVRTK